MNILTGGNPAHSHRYALPDHLRVGLYIHIDLPWFRHPFTLSSFKITSEDQIRELRALKVAHFRYDPERSDAPPAGAAPMDAPGAPDAAGPAEGDGARARSAAAADPRVRQLHEYRKAVQRTEKSFVKALGVMRRLDRNLFLSPNESMEEMGGLVGQMATVFIERPEATLHVMGENCGGEEVHHHALNVSILCMLLVKGLELASPQAGMLGIGALLHDIGLTEIPDRVAKQSRDEQTRPERELRARHVEFGVNIGRKLGLASEILSIIEQHHEMADGSGYPRGLLLEQIAPLARIVSLANFYENLCNPADFSHALTPHEALSHIFARRQHQFDAQILQVMIHSLGVYPPGSVVKLSNGAIAMVTSVNPNRSLRPWVMVYDPAVPRGEAGMLNLETEIGLNISNAIRPALLPAQVYAYLSPRRRIAYFFDGGSSIAAERK